MHQPLAYQMRPTRIQDVIGQKHLIGPGKIITRMVDAKILSSMILYGPPGTGKTSIASAIAGSTNYAFRILNAATDGKKELQIIAAEAKMSGTIVLLLDEIHRLDKVKQDFLLPLIEKGTIILIGATTENPYLNINPAIRSRVQIFEVHPLDENDIKEGLKKALSDDQRGLGEYPVQISDDTLTFLAQATNGDLRFAMNALELAVKSTPKNDHHQINITNDIITDCIQKRSIGVDKSGDNHYNTISALQKSIRGSDVDAALHYAARLIVGGDLVSLIRRLLVIAYEDVGLANPPAVSRAVQAINTAQQLGLPEARIPIANAIIELCLSPKSNSALTAIDAAISDIESQKIAEIPDHLKDAHYKGAKELNHGIDYKYPHDFPNDWVDQQYLPANLTKAQYYHPKNNGKFEQNYGKTYLNLRQSFTNK